MAQSKQSFRGLGILALLALLSWILWRSFRTGKSSSKTIALKNPTRNDELIIKILERAGYSPEMATLWAAVSRHETGMYTSALYTQANNLFGMKQPSKRLTTSIGTQQASEGTFAKFATKDSAVEDQILYMEEFNYPKNLNTASALVNFMKSKGYFGAAKSLYLAAVERQLK